MKSKFLRFLPILWVAIGLLFLASSFYGNYLIVHNQKNTNQMTHSYLPKEQAESRTAEITQAASDQQNFDPSKVSPVTPEEYAQAQLQYEDIVNKWGIGALYVPGTVETKILAGMTNQNLMVAVGTYYADQKLGKGNFVLLAHNLVQGGGSLGSINRITKGQIIYATDFTDIFEYQVVKSEVVNQNQGNLLEKPKKSNPALLTLVRCEGRLNTPNRALVQAEFKQKYLAKEASENVRIGLGFTKKATNQATSVESNTVATNQQSAASSQNEAQKQPVISSKKENHVFTSNKPIYNLFQRFAIEGFKLMNSHPIPLGITFLFVFAGLILIRSSMRDQKIL